jgi:hypothetical protein
MTYRRLCEDFPKKGYYVAMNLSPYNYPVVLGVVQEYGKDAIVCISKHRSDAARVSEEFREYEASVAFVDTLLQPTFIKNEVFAMETPQGYEICYAPPPRCNPYIKENFREKDRIQKIEKYVRKEWKKEVKAIALGIAEKKGCKAVPAGERVPPEFHRGDVIVHEEFVIVNGRTLNAIEKMEEEKKKRYKDIFGQRDVIATPELNNPSLDLDMIFGCVELADGALLFLCGIPYFEGYDDCEKLRRKDIEAFREVAKYVQKYYDARVVEVPIFIKRYKSGLVHSISPVNFIPKKDREGLMVILPLDSCYEKPTAKALEVFVKEGIKVYPIGIFFNGKPSDGGLSCMCSTIPK